MNVLLRTLLGAALMIGTNAFAQTPPNPGPDLRLESLTSGNWVPGVVRAVIRLPDGRFLIGGRFDRASGSLIVGNLLIMDREGHVDLTFAPNFTSSTALEIRALAVDGDKIYVGGLFEAVNATPTYSLARLNLDGSLDASWNAPFTSTSANEVDAIAVTANGVYVGGDLLEDDAWGLMKLDRATGARDASWSAQLQYNPTPTPSAGNRGEIYTIVPAGNDLYVGGSFGQIAGVAKSGVARISQASPVAVAAFDAGITGSASALVVSGHKLYVGGTFFRTSGAGPSYLNRVDATSGALDAFWSPTLNNTVMTMDLIGESLYVAGYFENTPSGGARLARIATDGLGDADASWNPNVSGGHVDVVVDDCRGHLLVGGDYLTISGASRNGFAGFTVPELECLFADGFELR